VTLFVHPWELDPNPPQIDLPWPLRFSHYFRLEGFAERLDAILSSADFGPIGEWALAFEGHEAVLRRPDRRVACGSPAAAAPPAVRGIGVDETLDREAVLAAALDRARLTGTELPMFVRLVVRQADLGDAGVDFGRLDDRLGAYGRRNVPVVLTLADPPADAAGLDGWRTAASLAGDHCRGRVLAYQVGDQLAAKRVRLPGTTRTS